MSNDKLVTFNADPKTWEKAKSKTEHGELSERFREELNAIAHGVEISEQERVSDLLKEKRKDKRDKQREITDLQKDVDEIEREIERLEDRLEALAEQDGEYDGFLQSLDELLKDGQHVFPDHSQIKKAAEIGGCSRTEVINDLKRRNPEIPEKQFEPKLSGR